VAASDAFLNLFHEVRAHYNDTFQRDRRNFRNIARACNTQSLIRRSEHTLPSDDSRRLGSSCARLSYIFHIEDICGFAP
jgi:hypothetical protein